MLAYALVLRALILTVIFIRRALRDRRQGEAAIAEA
jgi:hypothetical protein